MPLGSLVHILIIDIYKIKEKKHNRNKLHKTAEFVFLFRFLNY